MRRQTTVDAGAPSLAPGRRHRLVGRAREHRDLLAGSAALVIGAAVQAVTGAVFWLVAARHYDQADVGDATKLFTSVLTVGYATGLGLPVMLARYAPSRDRESHVVFAWAALATAIASSLGAVAYLLLVDTTATRSLTEWNSVLGPVLFVAMCAGGALSLIVDVRWMTVRRWSLVLVRITLTGLGRFPLLLLPTGGSDMFHLFAVALVPLALSGFLGVALLPRVTGHPHHLRPRPAQARAAIRYTAVNWISTLAYQGPQFVLPFVVLLQVGAEPYASFYVAWGITAVGMYVPMAIGQALLAEGGKDGAHLRSQVRVVLTAATGLMVLAAALTYGGRDIVTSVYGSDYADAARILPALVAGCVPWAITSVMLTEARVLHRHGATVAITATLTGSILIPALLLVPDDGIDGAARAFLLGNLVAAVVAVGSHLSGRSHVPRIVPAPEPADEIAEALHP